MEFGKSTAIGPCAFILFLGLFAMVPYSDAAKGNKREAAAKPSSTEAKDPAAKQVIEVRTTGTLYPLKSKFDQPLFRYERVTSEAANGKTVTVKFLELDGKLALEESVEFDAKGEFLRSRRNHPQINEITLIERRDKGVVFRREYKGSTKEASEAWGDNYISNDQLPPLIEKNWDALDAGKVFSMRLMVPSRLETVGFSVEKAKKTADLKGQPMEVFEMTPSSMLIRSFVDPIFFYFSKDRKLRWISGRMPVKRFDSKGKHHDLEAELLFD